MTKTTLWVFGLGVLFLISCKNTPNPPQTNASSGAENSSKIAEPDPHDLLRTLQGRWQSEQDASYTLEINDGTMRHYIAGKLSQESTIDVDGACESVVCKPDSVDTSDGWCFTEMFITNGKYDAQCNFVTLCDTARLQYRSLSGAGGGLSFKKIQ